MMTVQCGQAWDKCDAVDPKACGTEQWNRRACDARVYTPEGPLLGGRVAQQLEHGLCSQADLSTNTGANDHQLGVPVKVT